MELGNPVNFDGQTAATARSFFPGVGLETPDTLVRSDFEVPSTHVWGIDFSCVTMGETLDRLEQLIERRVPSQVITANLNYVMLFQMDAGLVGITRRAAMVLCDGWPIRFRSRWSDSPLPERVAGSDLIYRLSQRCAEKGHRIFLLGGAEGVADETARKLCQLYPELQIAGTECPPFSEWSQEYEAQLYSRIRESKADVLLVAFGQPKGERWIDENIAELGVPVGIQLGASFDFVAGTAKRAPRGWQRLGMEWCYRMLHDPRRLLPRYARNAWWLAWLLVRDMISSCSARSHG